MTDGSHTIRFGLPPVDLCTRYGVRDYVNAIGAALHHDDRQEVLDAVKALHASRPVRVEFLEATDAVDLVCRSGESAVTVLHGKSGVMLGEFPLPPERSA